MSRIGKQPIIVPNSVTLTVTDDNLLSVKGPKGELKKQINTSVSISVSDTKITIMLNDSSRNSKMQSGTARALISNMVTGVSKGFEKSLQLFGVGYRAKIHGDILNLTLGFSHPVDYKLPNHVTAETPSQTEIVLKSIDKELLGRTAADIRAYRIPEAYKGKGIRYSNEKIITKEAKKK